MQFFKENSSRSSSKYTLIQICGKIASIYCCDILQHEGELKFSLENLKYDESIIEMSVVMNSAEVRKEENVKISVLKDHKVDISPVHPNTTMNIDQTNNVVIRNFSINNSGRTKMRDAKVFVKYFDPKPKMIVVKVKSKN